MRVQGHGRETWERARTHLRAPPEVQVRLKPLMLYGSVYGESALR